MDEPVTSDGRPQLSRSLVDKLLIPIVLAAVPPFTTWVYSCSTKDRELKLAEVEQEYKALDRAVAADAAKPERKLVLTFLNKVSTNPRIRGWASSELENVSKELEARKEAELAVDERDQALAALAKAREEKGEGDSNIERLQETVKEKEAARRAAVAKAKKLEDDPEAGLIAGRLTFEPTLSCARIAGDGPDPLNLPPECRPRIDVDAQAYSERDGVARWTVSVGNDAIKCVCVLKPGNGLPWKRQ